jgi:hypothetical protein
VELDDILIQRYDIQETITQGYSVSPGEIMYRANALSEAHAVDDSWGYRAIRKSASAADAIPSYPVMIAK